MNAAVVAEALAAGVAAGALVSGLAWIWQLATAGSVQREGRPRSAEPLLNEPGELDRRELRRLRRRLLGDWLACSAALAATLTLVLTGDGLMTGLSSVAAVLIIVAAGLIGSGWLWRLIRLLQRLAAVKRRIVGKRRVAEQLGRVNGDHYRLFHDVSVDPDGARIDHVLIGVQGAFAVATIVAPVARDNEARIDGDRLRLGKRHEGASLAAIDAIVKRLQHQLSKPLGRMIRVRAVVAVPGWRPTRREFRDMMIASERDIVMLQGWRNASDSLLKEDVERLQDDLVSRSSD